MSLTLVSGPATEPITLAEAKDFLRIDDNASDTLVGALITSARQHLDGRDGLLGRALITQTWKLTLDGFPSAYVPGFPSLPASLRAWKRRGEIELPLPPCQSVTSITYMDTNGVTQTLAPSAYQVIGIGDDRSAWIAPAYGTDWPSTRDVPEAVTVTFVAGYGTAGTSLPGALRHAMLMHIASLFENREAVAFLRPDKVPLGYDELVAPHRIWGFGE